MKLNTFFGAVIGAHLFFGTVYVLGEYDIFFHIIVIFHPALKLYVNAVFHLFADVVKPLFAHKHFDVIRACKVGYAKRKQHFSAF